MRATTFPLEQPPGGGAAPTLEEVARLAGVSRATASRAVNGEERVSPKARDAVAAAVHQLGYVPNRAARSLVTRRTDAIAVVVPESDARLFSDPFFATILHGVTSALASTELQIMLLMGRRGETSDRMLRYLGGGHTDGAIVVSHHQRDRLAEALAESPMPSVFVGRPWSREVAVPYVDLDNRGGAVLAVRRLVDRGARRIATVAGPEDMSAAVDRLAGWRHAMAEAGLPQDAVEFADFTAPGGAHAMERLLAHHPDIDGVFIASDLMASGALPVAAAHGRRVPLDLLVVGFDDNAIAQQTRPPLTTLTNPGETMATLAVEMLLGQLAGRGRPDTVTVPTRLVVRTSA